ncbi:MAG: hypothetical protein H6744_01610 [Deltaproteobacteria bacterium]|nr:hypothetical protein [Deltaproteobacteria bacterium]
MPSPRRLAARSLLLTALLLAPACSDSHDAGSTDIVPDSPDVSGDIPVNSGPQTVQTSLSPATIRAGETATVTCTALDSDGVEVPGQSFEITTDPSVPQDTAGTQLAPTAVGTFTVTCASGALIDDSPAELVVTPGVPHATVATVVPPEITAGGSSTVSCAVADAYGNPVPDAASTVVVAGGASGDVSVSIIDPSSATVASNVAGTYEVTCEIAGTDRQTASWTVVAGPPVTFALAIDPEPLAYVLGQGIKVSGTGADEYGNPVTDIPVAGLDATPAGHHTVFGPTQGSIRFDLEGFYTLSAHAESDASLSATKDIVVDETPPLIEITSPVRGFVADGVQTVSFAGTVSDNLGTVASLELNGNTYALPAEGGPFELTVPLVYGINPLDAHAADPYGNERTVTRAAIWSQGWYTLLPAAYDTDRVQDGIVAELSQEGVDQLSGVLESVLAGGDLAGLVGSSGFKTPCIGGQCDLVLKSITMTSGTVKLKLLDGGIHLDLALGGLDVVMNLKAPGLPAFDIRIAVDTLSLKVDLALTVTNGVISAKASSPKINIGDITVGFFEQIDLGVLDDLANAAIDYIEPALVGILETVFVFLAEGLIEDLINGLADSIAIDTELELPALAEGLNANVIHLESRPSQMQFTPDWMRIDLDALANASVPAPPHEVSGSVRYESCAPVGSVPTPPASPIVAGLHEDFINELLFAIWQGGTLSIDLGAEAASAFDLGAFGIDLQSVKVDPFLPLVLSTCAGDKRVQIGDLFLDATLDLLGTPSHIALWIQAEAIVDVVPSTTDTGATQLAFDIGTFDPITLEVVTNEGIFEGDDAGLIDLVGGQLLPLLIDQLAGDSLAFELPTIDLGDLITGLPAGSTIDLKLGTIGKSGAFLTLDAALE